MNTDCAFYIGTTHNICQDYAIAGKNSIIVSDGCSGSPNSDIGSRIISIIAMNKMSELNSLYEFEEKECILLARPSVKMLNISNECLDATLLSSIVYNKTLQAMCCGDGVIVIKIKTGETIIINCEYTDSYPFFMNYLYDRTGRYKDWKDNHNNRKITLTILSLKKEINYSKEIFQSTRFQASEMSGNICFIEILDNKIIIDISDKEKIEYIAIMSDGIHSFYETIITETSRYNKPLSYIDVLKDLLSFKNFNKYFVQRRINKFHKNCNKKNWANADDFSLAVIYLG